jgi:hypothetical protein
MTNLGGPGFFVLVYGLFMTAGTPVLVLSWLAVVRYLEIGVGWAFAVVNGSIFVVGLVMVTLWTMPLLATDPTGSALRYILFYVGLAIAVIVLLEAIPLALGIVATERYAGAPRRPAAYAAAGGWFLGAVLGIVVVALLAPGFFAVLGAVPGALVGAVGGGPLLYSRFGGREPTART